MSVKKLSIKKIKKLRAGYIGPDIACTNSSPAQIKKLHKCIGPVNVY